MPEGVLEYYSLSKTYYVLPGTQSRAYIWGSRVPGKHRKIDFKIFSGIFSTPINKMGLIRVALFGWWKVIVFPRKIEKMFFDGQLQQCSCTALNMCTRFYFYLLSFLNTCFHSLVIGSIIVPWQSRTMHIPNIQYLQLISEAWPTKKME